MQYEPPETVVLLLLFNARVQRVVMLVMNLLVFIVCRFYAIRIVLSMLQAVNKYEMDLKCVLYEFFS